MKKEIIMSEMNFYDREGLPKGLRSYFAEKKM